MLNLKFDDSFGIIVQFPFRVHALNYSVTYTFCAMAIFKMSVQSKIGVVI